MTFTTIPPTDEEVAKFLDNGRRVAAILGLAAYNLADLRKDTPTADTRKLHTLSSLIRYAAESPQYDDIEVEFERLMKLREETDG